MAEAKTRPTNVSVQSYIGAIADRGRRADCEVLVTLMSKVTGCPPVMWGPSIIGFGSYHYRYESGHEGDAPLAGFASRKTDLSIYLVPGFDVAKGTMARLGKCKTAKACLYVKRLADIDLAVLEKLIRQSVAEVRRRYP